MTNNPQMPLAPEDPEVRLSDPPLVEDPELRWLFYYVTAEDVARAYRAALGSELRFGVFYIGADDSTRSPLGARP